MCNNLKRENHYFKNYTLVDNDNNNDKSYRSCTTCSFTSCIRVCQKLHTTS